MYLEVDNIKCEGCAGSIRRGLLSLNGVTDVAVDVAAGSVTVTTEENRLPEVSAKLAAMGYPERGSVHGLRSAGAKARSFVSCAVGRMQND